MAINFLQNLRIWYNHKMHLLAGILGFALLLLILIEGFETIIQTRTVTRELRITRLFYITLWKMTRGMARHLPSGSRRETLLGTFGPLSLLLLLVMWATGLIIAFAFLQWALSLPGSNHVSPAGFGTDIYFSGTTFFTLGYGDLTPTFRVSRALAVAEAGLGFGFLAVVIGYLPVLYQVFSRREARITLLDARGGSPPAAAEMLRRAGNYDGMDTLDNFLRDWELWCSELLESSVSYPVLAYYRSQHEATSWLTALTMILDVCALILSGVGSLPRSQAQLTFAMARHAAVDLCLIFHIDPVEPQPDRLPAKDLAQIRDLLSAAGCPMRDDPQTEKRLRDLRRTYEPYVCGLSHQFMFTLPPWLHPKDTPDNWQTSAWERVEDHF